MQIYLTPERIEAEESRESRWLRLRDSTTSSIVIFFPQNTDIGELNKLADSFNRLLEPSK